MSATFAHRYLVPRHDNTVFSYWSIDLAVVGLACILLLATGPMGGLDKFRQLGTSLPFSSASVDSPSQEPAQIKTVLTPAMKAALDSVAQRYRVAPKALQPIFEVAQTAASARSLDPLLIIAIIGIESGFNPYAQSVMGAQGLMQIIPRYHQDKLPKENRNAAFLEPVSNVRVGAHVLQEAIRRQGGLIEGLQYYAGAADDLDSGYAARVIAEKQRLEQASRRKEAPVGAAGARPLPKA